jgi:hypothetical protein
MNLVKAVGDFAPLGQHRVGDRQCVEVIGLALVRSFPEQKLRRNGPSSAGAGTRMPDAVESTPVKVPALPLSRVELSGALQQVEHQFLVEILTVGVRESEAGCHLVCSGGRRIDGRFEVSAYRVARCNSLFV